MRITERALVVLSVAGLMVAIGVGPAAGQGTAPGQEPAQSQEQGPIEGELVAVDTDAMALAVRTADGQSVQFRYTAETEVSGAQDSIEGLATQQNARVTVHFTEEQGTRTATRIQVQPAQ